MSRFPVAFFLLLTVALLAGPQAWSQTTFATITGSVTDATGAVVPGAEVVANHVDSNYRYSTRSNDAGVFTLPQLREGQYTVSVNARGFSEFRVQDIELASRDVRRVDAHLSVGDMGSRVEVFGGATLIETESARISSTQSANKLRDMPMVTRSITAYFNQTANVMASAYFRFAGSKGNQSDASIDGVTIGANDASYIGPQYQFMESYQELRVDLANNTSEFSSVGQMAMISKSGSNDWHGSAFDYFASTAMTARDPFSPTSSSYVQHSPGGSLGGPLSLPRLYKGRNRTFFFASYETQQGGAVRQLLNPTVPLASWRNGDFSQLLPGTVIRDPNNNQPFAGNIIPQSRINPVSQKIQNRFWPLPNFGDPNVLLNQNYREIAVRPYDPSTLWTARVDHRFSDKSFVFGRYTWTRSYQRQIDGNVPALGQRWQQRDTRSATVSHTHSLRPNLLNELRWGVIWNNNPRQPPTIGNEVVRDLGLQGLAPDIPDIPGIPKVSFTGLGLSGLAVQTDYRNPGVLNWATQWQDHVNWFRGRHSVKTGAQYLIGALDDRLANPSLFGNLSFSNRFSNFPYADFLLGIPTTVSRANPPVTISTRRRAFGAFVTDDFKVTRRLTLNLGLRYDIIPGWTENNGRQAIFDPASGSIVIPDGASRVVSPLMPLQYIPIVEASKVGRPGDTLYKTDKNNWAPRVGFALRPWDNNTVFRGGFGIFYDVVPPSFGGGTPFVVTESAYTNPANAPTVILPQAFPTATQAPTSVAIPGGVRSDLRVPFSMQYNATLEHQHWNMGFRLSYIGTNTRQGQYNYNINQPIASAQAFVNKSRPFPNYPAINYLTNGSGHQYHSMTMEVTRPLARGLTYRVAYTLARDIGDLDWRQAPEDAYNRQRERGPSIDAPTHRLVSNALYELPFGKGKRFLSNSGRWSNLIFGGWQVTAIYDFTSGQFLSPLWTGPDPTGTAFTATATPAVVTIRPNILRNPNLPSGGAVGRWFDVGAFGAPSAGAFGTSGPGVIIGPHQNLLHGGIIKYVNVWERVKIRLELMGTNVLNHPQWSNPGLNISQAAQAGVISSVGGVYSNDQTGPRNMRVALRLEW